MSFLLDTNVLIEVNKHRPDRNVSSWFASVADEDIWHSVLVVAELRRGAIAASSTATSERVEAFVKGVLAKPEERLLPISLRVAEEWAGVAERHKAGRIQINAIDELIAATAIAHNLTVVTRNIRHFERSGCRLLSPWLG